MISFALNRIAYAVAVMLGVSALVFALVFLAGDPVAGLLPPGSSPALQAAMRDRLGLDQPVTAQYLGFLRRVAAGNFGDSWRQGRPALTVVVERLPFTLALAGSALTLAVLASLGLGVLAGLNPAWRWPVQLLAIAGQSVPAFWLGTLLILLFSVRLGWLPASGYTDPRSLILPALTLSLFPAAMLTRLIQASLSGTLRQDYVRTARGKGLTPLAVVRKHALRNAFLPALGFAGVQLGFLIGGAVVVEGVFAYPGIGQLALTAVTDRDLPVIQAFALTVAALIVAGGVLVELLARLLDPRLDPSASPGGR